ncbi:uncharacterized protein [Danio rerio]|uniref:Uncharacterized protein n=1 Tax=Danio rerio TaxID=7955 RepID=A0AC58IRV4_DANRE
MMLTGLMSFSVVLIFLNEGSSVRVHPGGNITLPCSIKDDREINWIITDGNQTFVRIMRVDNNYGPEFKLGPSNIHPNYSGRIRSVSSSTNTHSLLLLNITEDDLLLFCCLDYKIECTCTKLDSKENNEGEKTEVRHFCIMIWLPVISVLLLLSLMSNVCMCWRIKRPKKGNLKASKPLHKNTEDKQGNEADEITYASVNINKIPKNRGHRHHPTQDTVYARIK